MNLVLRLIALLIITLLALSAYAYVMHYAAVLFFPRIDPRPWSEMIICAVAGALSASLVTSISLAFLFHHRAWIAALFVALPIIVLRIEDVVSYTGPLMLQVQVMAVFEAITYLVAVVLSSWLVSLRWPSSNPAFKRDALKRAP